MQFSFFEQLEALFSKYETVMEKKKCQTRWSVFHCARKIMS